MEAVQNCEKPGYYFLASPYSVGNPTEEVMERRFKEAIEATYNLMKRGLVVFSAIVHSHPIAVEHGLARSHNFWHPTNTTMIKNSLGVIVLDTDPVWKHSVGIAAELEYAHHFDKPIHYLSEIY